MFPVTLTGTHAECVRATAGWCSAVMLKTRWNMKIEGERKQYYTGYGTKCDVLTEAVQWLANSDVNEVKLCASSLWRFTTLKAQYAPFPPWNLIHRGEMYTYVFTWMKSLKICYWMFLHPQRPASTREEAVMCFPSCVSKHHLKLPDLTHWAVAYQKRWNSVSESTLPAVVI